LKILKFRRAYPTIGIKGDLGKWPGSRKASACRL